MTGETARFAADVRLARRQALRTPGASALVAGLVALGTAYVTWSVVDSSSRWAFAADDPVTQFWLVLPSFVIAAFAVVMLAGSALMVSTRQQRRMHAVAASIGARRSDIHRVVLMQAALLGLVGGVVGIAVGIAGCAVTTTLVPQWDGSSATLVVPWGWMPGLLLFALGVSLVAAAVPARSASLADPLVALRDGRGETVPVRGRAVAAIALAVTGLGMTAGALIVFSLPNPDGPAWIALLGAVVGPILVIIGFLLGARWVLKGLAAVLGRLDTAARIAGRDAAVHPRRVAPAIAVVAASAFVATALATFAATLVQPFADSYQWSAVPGSVIVTVDPDADGAESDARTLLEPMGPDEIVTLSAPAVTLLGAEAEPDFPTFTIAVNSAACETCFEPHAEVTIVPADGIDAVLNTDVPQAARDVLRGGGAIIPAWPGLEEGITRAEVVQSTLGRDFDVDGTTAEPVRTEIPAVEIEVHSAYSAIITPETAAALGIDARPHSVIGTLSTPLRDETARELQTRGPEGAILGVLVESGPQETASTAAVPIFAPAIILAFSASVVALGLSRYERRRDSATLAALGASRRLLRRIGAWEALIVTGTGALVGTLAGAALVIGFAEVAGMAGPAALLWPWGWIAALGVGLPTVMTVGAWLVPPRHPDLTRRTAIA